MAQPSFIPGNPNLITETLYKPQEDYAFVNDCKAEAFRRDPYFIRERDGPFIQAYYQHYEADIPYKNAVFAPQVKPAALAHRQCNPLVAYPYGMPQNVEYEKCKKCKGNKKCSRRKTQSKRKSMKNMSRPEVEDLFSSKLKAENDAYELQENTNDDLKNMNSIHVQNGVSEGDICKSTSYCSNAPPYSNNFEVSECDMGINEKCNANDINNNNVSNYTHAGAKMSSFDNFVDHKIHGKMEKYFSHELENCLHFSIKNNEIASSMQNLYIDTTDMNKELNTNVHDDADCKKEATQGNEQYCLKVNDKEVRKHSNLRIINSDTVREEEVKDDKDKDEIILNRFTNVVNENIEGSQKKEDSNDDEIGSSTLTKSPKKQTYDDVNVPEKKDFKKEIINQEFTGVKENPKNTKQVYICDNVKTVSYHVERKKSSDEDLTKCIIKKKKNKTNEANTTIYKNKEEDEKQIKPNKYVSLHPERTKKATQPRVCHVEVMLAKKEKNNVKSKQKVNDQNRLQPSVTNVEEFFPDVPRKTYDKKRLLHFPTNMNKEVKNKLKEQITEANSKNEESTTTQDIYRLITDETSSQSKTTNNTSLNKNRGSTKTDTENDQALQKLSAISLIKKKKNINGSSKKPANKKLVKKSNEDTSEKNLTNKPNNQKGKKKLKGKRLLSRSTTVFYGSEKPIPFKTTEVKRFSENIPTESDKLKSLKSNDSENSIKIKNYKDIKENKKDTTTEMGNVSKQLKSDTITKKLKSKKKELYDNILSLTKNIKKNKTDDVMNKRKGDIEQSLQNLPDKEENIFGKNVDNNEMLVNVNLKKSKSVKEKISSTKHKEENQNIDRNIAASTMKNKMKITKGIKENAKELKTEEKKKKNKHTKEL